MLTLAPFGAQDVSYDAQFEAMEVPAHVKSLRAGAIRSSDVEMTFVKGRWNHLGEATLSNRVKSHPDVGERYYPEILRRIREEEAAAQTQQTSSLATEGVQVAGTTISVH